MSKMTIEICLYEDAHDRCFDGQDISICRKGVYDNNRNVILQTSGDDYSGRLVNMIKVIKYIPTKCRLSKLIF